MQDLEIFPNILHKRGGFDTGKSRGADLFQQRLVTEIVYIQETCCHGHGL